MARASKLKVFRTPIGFHDAYVAAPSQKAALEAWGSDRDLFARGVAEVVTEPTLTEEPLSKPGVVVRRLRGTAAEQIAALPPGPQSTSAATPRPKRAPPRSKPKHQPPPDRTGLEKAQKTLEESKSRHQAEERVLREKEASLARERRDLEKAHAAEIRRLEDARDQAEAEYRRAMRKWQG